MPPISNTLPFTASKSWQTRSSASAKGPQKNKALDFCMKTPTHTYTHVSEEQKSKLKLYQHYISKS